METLDTPSAPLALPVSAGPRPRRRLSPPPPSPADPLPWQKVLGYPLLTLVEQTLLMRISNRHSIAAGDPVLDTHGPAQSLVLLLSGDVVLGSRGSDGHLRTELSLTGPAWLDISSAWLGLPHVMEAQALSDVVIAEVPMAALRPELAAMPQLALRLCVTLAQRVQELTEASRNLLHNDAPARFAQWLLQRCPAQGERCELHLQERKRDIAQQLAMTPETLSRLFRNFETRGLVSARGYDLTVHDLGALRTMAGSPAVI